MKKNLIELENMLTHIMNMYGIDTKANRSDKEIAKYLVGCLKIYINVQKWVDNELVSTQVSKMSGGCQGGCSGGCSSPDPTPTSEPEPCTGSDCGGCSDASCGTQEPEVVEIVIDDK